MNCSEIQQRLSAYHDGELSQVAAAEVATHLAGCRMCATELATFERLSEMTRRLTDPPLPAHMWDELEAKLHGEGLRPAKLRRIMSHHVGGRILAAAAMIFVATGVGIVAYQGWLVGAGHDHIAVNFANYLNEFDERPDEAQQILLAKYDGRQTTLQEAADVLGYEPAVAKGLPPGHSLEEVYLIQMPCCLCAQVVCKDENGHSIAIFEHNTEQPVWFSDRPTVECLCHDVPTTVVQVDGGLAATWKEGKRFITIVGAHDLEEVSEFVAYYGGSELSDG